MKPYDERSFQQFVKENIVNNYRGLVYSHFLTTFFLISFTIFCIIWAGVKL